MNRQDDSQRDNVQGGQNPTTFKDKTFLENAPRFVQALKNNQVIEELARRAGLTAPQIEGYSHWFAAQAGTPRTGEVVQNRINDEQAAAIGPYFWRAVQSSPQIAQQTGLTPEKLTDFVDYATTQLKVDIKAKGVSTGGSHGLT